MKTSSLVELPDEILASILQHHFISLNTHLRVKQYYDDGTLFNNDRILPHQQKWLAIMLTCKTLHSIAFPVFYEVTVFKLFNTNYDCINRLFYPRNHPPYDRIQCLSGGRSLLEELLEAWTNGEQLFSGLKHYIMKSHVHMHTEFCKLRTNAYYANTQGNHSLT